MSSPGAIIVTTNRALPGEGLQRAQGRDFDPNDPGKGNTIYPGFMLDEPLDHTATSEDYREAMDWALNKSAEELAPYMVSSLKYNRILSALITAAGYLKEFARDVKKKRIKNRVRLLREREKHTQELVDTRKVPDPDKYPKEFLTYELVRLISEGNQEKTIDKFFSSFVFDGLNKDMEVLVEIFNRLLSIYTTETVNRDQMQKTIKLFLKSLMSNIIELSENDDESIEVAKVAQRMVGQVLTILSWVDKEVYGAAGIRVTSDQSRMVQSERGRSCIDSTTIPDRIRHTMEEGDPGFFWRGAEDISRLGGKGENVIEELQVRTKRFTASDHDLRFRLYKCLKDD